MDLATITTIATTIASIATPLTLLIGFAQIRQAEKTQAEERNIRIKQEKAALEAAEERKRAEAYDALDEKYIDFQRLCLQYPYLDIFDIRDTTSLPIDEGQVKIAAKQELIAFTLLFSIFERAYVMYQDTDEKTRTRQWAGWEEYIRMYCERPNFRAAWEISGQTFDTNFQDYMQKTLAEVQP